MTVVFLQITDDAERSKISEGDSKYLAREVLQGIYTQCADIFSLGISMMELSTDLVLPISGPLWHMLRDEVIPKQIIDGKGVIFIYINFNKKHLSIKYEIKLFIEGKLLIFVC